MNKDEFTTDDQSTLYTMTDKKNLLSAVPSRLLEVGHYISSSKTGKTLKCYNVMACYVGFENKFKNWDYFFWDEEKNKSKCVCHRDLREWLEGVWYVVA